MVAVRMSEMSVKLGLLVPARRSNQANLPPLCESPNRRGSPAIGQPDRRGLPSLPLGDDQNTGLGHAGRRTPIRWYLRTSRPAVQRNGHGMKALKATLHSHQYFIVIASSRPYNERGYKLSFVLPSRATVRSNSIPQLHPGALQTDTGPLSRNATLFLLVSLLGHAERWKRETADWTEWTECHASVGWVGVSLGGLRVVPSHQQLTRAWTGVWE